MKKTITLFFLFSLSPLLWLALLKNKNSKPNDLSFELKRKKIILSRNQKPSEDLKAKYQKPLLFQEKKLSFTSLAQTLKRGMPKGTQIEIDHVDSFLEKGELKDILLIKTTFPNGNFYAYKASYYRRTKTIHRTWGGSRHHEPSSDKFSYNPAGI